jgi:4-hydroxymandelate oxidase
VFTSGPRPPACATAQLSIRRVVRRAFAGPATSAADPDRRSRLREYLSDLVRPYGTVLREDLFASANGQSYGEMAAAVAPDEPVDVVVLAYAIPDVRPGRATATYLSHILPGNPFAFAICDQGPAAGFTGLRLVREYLGGDEGRRGLLIVVEQSVLHYEPTAPAGVPDGHYAVAMLCTASGPARVAAIDQFPGVTLDEAPALLAGCHARTAILGSGLASVDLSTVELVRRASPGRPYTGVWWELAEEYSSGQALLIAEYDAMLGYLCVSTVDGEDDDSVLSGVDRVSAGGV